MFLVKNLNLSEKEQSKHISKSEPIPAIYLEKAIEETKVFSDKESVARLYQELLYSELLLSLAPNQSIPEDINSSNSFRIQLAVYINAEKNKFAVGFTNANNCKQWMPGGANYILLRGQEIFKLLKSTKIEVFVVNPGLSTMLIIPKENFKMLSEGVIPDAKDSPLKQFTQNSNEFSRIKIDFPKNVFSLETLNLISQEVNNIQYIDAYASGVVLLPQQSGTSKWTKTLFLRIKQLDDLNYSMEQLCKNIHLKISKDAIKETDNNTSLTLMLHFIQNNKWVIYTPVRGLTECCQPAENFWELMNENNYMHFERNRE